MNKRREFPDWMYPYPDARTTEIVRLKAEHGAELGIIEGHKFDRGLRGFDLVRPAPAEEKVPVRCPTCGGAPHPYPPSLDRRKAGERRRIRVPEALCGRPHSRCCDRRKP